MRKTLLSFLFLFSTTLLFSQALTIGFTSQNNVTCNSSCDGSATAVASGGTAPYTYSWTGPSYSAATPTATGLCAGVYTCTVTDAAMATTSGTVVIAQPTQLTISGTPTNVTCNSACNGQISTTVSGGTAPYTYMWTPFNLTTPNVGPLCPGNYTVTVTDANGCTATTVIAITQPPAMNVTINPSNPTICQGGNIALMATGGITYVWAPGLLSGNPVTVAPTVTTTYTVTATDPNGCTGTATTTVSVDNLSGTTSAIEAGCNMSDGSAIVTPVGGTSPYAYSWSPTSQTTQVATVAAGTYAVVVTDANGCTYNNTVTVGDSCNFVWPGDANDDAVADNTDILDIGVANGATGTTRANATINWIGQPSVPWGQTLASGTDYKWVDCNGDGTIDPNDTTAVIQNFGLTHNNRVAANPPYNASLPDLAVNINQTQLGAGSQGALSISLGNSTTPASNVYGVAFTLNFDPAQVDASTFRMNENGTWMGTPGVDLMGVVINSGGGSVQVAITRLNQANANGFGTIANMVFTTTGALVGTGSTQNVLFTISNVTVISANETPQSVNAVPDSVTVCDPLTLGINSLNASAEISVSPNPFTDQLVILTPASAAEKTVVITDMTGRVVMTQTGTEAKIILRRGDLESGVYICTVYSAGEIIAHQQVIAK